MAERLVINGRGEEKTIVPINRTTFDDKKIPVIDESRILRHLVEARNIYRSMEVGQREGKVTVNPRYPNLPIYVWCNTDDHIGSVLTDYDAFLRDYNAIKETPNFYVASDGDEPDNFMVTNGACTGVYENPITPGQQAILVRSLFTKLDEQHKLVVMSFGNHNQWVRGVGYKFENTWLDGLHCPILNCGGLLHLVNGSQTYDWAISHSHWGNSKLNPTNACKRMLEHDYPDADIAFLGHTHMKEVLRFNRGGKERIALIGGTYKVDDEFGAEHGMGSLRSSEGGITIALFPDRRKMIPFYTVEEAVDDFNNRLKGLK